MTVKEKMAVVTEQVFWREGNDTQYSPDAICMCYFCAYSAVVFHLAVSPYFLAGPAW